MSGGMKREVHHNIQCQHLARSLVPVPSGRRKKVGGKKRTQTKSTAGKKSSGLKRRKRLTKKRRGKKTRVRSRVSKFLPVIICHFQPSVKAP